MKYSKPYILYPVNRALERAIAGSLGLLDEEMLKLATPDRSVPVADNFLYTRGNFEQHSFSANVFESLRAAIEATLTDELRSKEPLTWAEMQNRLGNILGAIGQKQRVAVHHNVFGLPDVEMTDPKLFVDAGQQFHDLKLAPFDDLEIESAGQVNGLQPFHPGQGNAVLAPSAGNRNGDLVLAGAIESPVVR